MSAAVSFASPGSETAAPSFRKYAMPEDATPTRPRPVLNDAEFFHDPASMDRESAWTPIWHIAVIAGVLLAIYLVIAVTDR